MRSPAARSGPRLEPATAASGSSALRALQLVVGAVLDDPAARRARRRGRPGAASTPGARQQRGAAGEHVAQAVVDRLLGAGVDGAGGVVEHEDRAGRRGSRGPARPAAAARPTASARARRRRCRSRPGSAVTNSSACAVPARRRRSRPRSRPGGRRRCWRGWCRRTGSSPRTRRPTRRRSECSVTPRRSWPSMQHAARRRGRRSARPTSASGGLAAAARRRRARRARRPRCAGRRPRSTGASAA